MGYKSNMNLPAYGKVDAVLSDGVLTATTVEHGEKVFEVPAASKEEASDILHDRGAFGAIEWAEWNPIDFAAGQIGPGSATPEPQGGE